MLWATDPKNTTEQQTAIAKICRIAMPTQNSRIRFKLEARIIVIIVMAVMLVLSSFWKSILWPILSKSNPIIIGYINIHLSRTIHAILSVRFALCTWILYEQAGSRDSFNSALCCFIILKRWECTVCSFMIFGLSSLQKRTKNVKLLKIWDYYIYNIKF